MMSWPDLDCSGSADVFGEPPPPARAEPQAPPRNGTGPRLDAARAGTRARKLPFILLAFRGADGYPVVHSVEIADAGPDGILLTAADASLLPPRGPRAGLPAHAYEEPLVALPPRQVTGRRTAPGGPNRAPSA